MREAQHRVSVYDQAPLARPRERSGLVWVVLGVLSAGVVLGVVLMGSQRTSVSSPYTRVAESWEATETERAVSARLRDPESAVFSRVILANPDGSFCGLVSGRNGFGGRGQQMMFWRVPGAVWFDDPAADSTSDARYAATGKCASSARREPVG